MNRKPDFVRRGFTIIEVTIVLAIFALVIAMVFFAVQNAQRQSRDAKRKADVLVLSQAIEKWTSDNGGKFPRVNYGGTCPVGYDICFYSGSWGDLSYNEAIDPNNSPFCQQNYLPNKCQDFIDPISKTPYRFEPDSPLDCNNNDPKGDVPRGSPAWPASLKMVFNSNTRSYTIDECLESGQYSYKP